MPIFGKNKSPTSPSLSARSRSKTLGDFFHKKSNEDLEPELQITGPVNVKHEGHVGFSENSSEIETRNLPPEYQQLFENLNKKLEMMGVTSLTKKELKFVLRALPTLVPTEKTSPQPPKKNSNEGISSPKKLSRDLPNPTKIIVEQEKKIIELEKNQRGLREENHSLALEVAELKTRLNHVGNDVSFIEKPIEELKSKMLQENKLLETQLEEKSLLISKLQEENQRLREEMDAFKKEKTKIQLPVEEIPPSPAPQIPSAPLIVPTLPARKRTEAKQNVKEKNRVNSKFLDAIRNPKALRHVSEEEKEFPKDVDDPNLLDLIAKALIERRQKIKEDEEDLDENDDCGSWD